MIIIFLDFINEFYNIILNIDYIYIARQSAIL